MEFDDAVAAALSSLDSVDPASAADAQIGWDGLRSISPRSGPTQNSVQTFLWSRLVDVTDDSARAWDIARALADLLDRLGHSRYADIARSATTRAILLGDDTGTAEDEATRQQRVLDAVEDSGIGPEDTDLITWLDDRAGVERSVADLISETLEVAAVAGEFAPTREGGRPPRPAAQVAKRRQLTDSVLRSERAGGVLLEQLLDHRIALWTRYSPPRAELYRDLSVSRHEAAEPASSGVRRLEGLLGIVGDGITLDERGYLPGAVVERAVGTLWTPREWPFPTGEELDTEPVLRIRRLLLRLGLVRKHHGRLLPTARARGMSADRMWRILVSRTIGTVYHPDTIAAEVVLAEVARGRRPEGSSELLTELLTAEGWSHVGGTQAAHAEQPLGDGVLADLTALGALSYAGAGRADAVVSPDGSRLAAALLRHRLLHTRLPSV